jgi:hypothetical protein
MILNYDPQAKQKKNNRKIKDKDREEKFDSSFPEKDKDDSTIHDMEDSKQAGQVDMKVDTSEEGASDMSDNFDGSAEVCQTDAGDKILQPLGGMNVVGIETENMSTGKNCIVESNLSSCSSESATMNIMQGKRDNLPAGSSQILPCLRLVSIVSVFYRFCSHGICDVFNCISVQRENSEHKGHK